MNTENSKTNEPHRFRHYFTNKLNLKNLNKTIVLANLSIYYTWKNIKSEYNNNKFKIHGRLGMKHLTYLMGTILSQIYRNILNT